MGTKDDKRELVVRVDVARIESEVMCSIVTGNGYRESMLASIARIAADDCRPQLERCVRDVIAAILDDSAFRAVLDAKIRVALEKGACASAERSAGRYADRAAGAALFKKGGAS